MDELYELLPLVKFYIYFNVILTIICALFGLTFLIKKLRWSLYNRGRRLDRIEERLEEISNDIFVMKRSPKNRGTH